MKIEKPPSQTQVTLSVSLPVSQLKVQSDTWKPYLFSAMVHAANRQHLS